MAPARIRWALELLDIEKSSNVFEIGCGSGIAAQRICPVLGRGSYMGVDKSPAAIKASLARNANYAKAGRATFVESAFSAADREPQVFDRILAVNVNAFWSGDGAEILDVRRLMHSRSLFVQVYEPPEADQRARIARILKRRLAPYFGNVIATMRTTGGAKLLAIVATGEMAKQAA
ncbi:MAG: class I SAM-dependent methyltransferase [Hyphomonadaceae bacterium]|nr:class I SAM-dependent methyltransferase [Hyphomonadaceae bacterium]